MRHIAKSIIILTAIILFSASPALAAPDIVPGMWEITTQVSMAGMPMAMPKNTMQQCLDKKDLVPGASAEQDGCKMKSTKITGNTVTWELHCKTDGTKTKSKGSITYRGTSFSGSININMTGESGTQSMKQTMEGKRIGKCTK